jgi:ABC-type bacteriocin/lantibiotic exporter with double-glycine peptidase domain
MKKMHDKQAMQIVKHSPYKILVFFLRRHFVEYLALTVLAVVVGVLEGLNLALFVPLLNVLVGTESAAYSGNRFISAIYEVITFVPIDDKFIAAGMLFLGMTLLKGGLSISHEYFSAKVTGRFLHGYRIELLERNRLLPLREFQDMRIGAMVYDLTQPPIMLTRLLYMLPRFVVDSMRFIFVFALLIVVEPLITLMFFAGALSVYLLFTRRASQYLYHLGLTRRAVEQSMASIATEWFRGIRGIRIGNAEGHWIESFTKNSDKAREVYVRTSVALASPRHVFEMVAFSLLLIGLMWAYWANHDAFKDQLATISLFAVGLIRVLPSVAALARAPLDIRTTMPDVEYLYRILQQPVTSEENGKIAFTGLHEAIRLENVDVEYEGRGKALDGVSLEIPQNASIAIVGPSGSGKSTLLNLLIGVQRPNRGNLKFDTTSLSDIDGGSLFRRVGYVGQDTSLFFGTIRDNITFFRQGIPAERVRWAAEIAEIDSFIDSLPQGYETKVGEGGVNLSGGQMQRIAIARALLNNPDLLVLDEPTSALDASSERAVLHALEHAAEGRTVVMVTHKLPSVAWVDRIYVMDHGRIVQSGTYKELLADTSGKFFRMYSGEQNEYPGAIR